MNFWVSFAAGVVLTALQAAIKNPNSKEQMRKVARQIYDTILLGYPEFKDE